MKARARCELKQLCCNCYINDFWIKMNDVSEHSKFCYPEKKRGKARWSYDKVLIDWVRSGRTIKYLALGHGARTSLRSVLTPWPRAKYFPVRPSHSVNKYIIAYIRDYACHPLPPPPHPRALTFLTLSAILIKKLECQCLLPVLLLPHVGTGPKD